MRIYNATPFDLTDQPHIARLAWMPNWDQGGDNPDVFPVWTREQRNEQQPPTEPQIREPVANSDPALPIAYNGEWGASIFGNAAWDRRSYDLARDLMAMARDAAGPDRPIGVYGIPVSRRRPNNAEWTQRYDEFLRVPLEVGLADHVTWLCPSLYRNVDDDAQEFAAITRDWFERMADLYGLPIVPFVSIEVYDRPNPRRMATPAEFRRDVAHAIDLSTIDACILWTRHAVDRPLEEIEPYLEVIRAMMPNPSHTRRVEQRAGQRIVVEASERTIQRRQLEREIDRQRRARDELDQAIAANEALLAELDAPPDEE